MDKLEKKKSFLNGCDDYLVKPFEPTELLLRIKKLLNPRFNKNLNVDKRYFGDFEFDFGTRNLTKNNINVNLTSSELLIIEFLSKNLNKEITRRKLLIYLKLILI